MENISEWISSFSNDEIISMHSEIIQRPKREKTSIADVLQHSLEKEWILRNGNRKIPKVLSDHSLVLQE